MPRIDLGIHCMFFVVNFIFGSFKFFGLMSIQTYFTFLFLTINRNTKLITTWYKSIFWNYTIENYASKQEIIIIIWKKKLFVNECLKVKFQKCCFIILLKKLKGPCTCFMEIGNFWQYLWRGGGWNAYFFMLNKSINEPNAQKSNGKS